MVVAGTGIIDRMTSADRPRRTCLTVPGSSERFLAKAATLAPDELILDLEDAVAPAAKDTARTLVAQALASTDWVAPLRAVRINDALSRWAHRDVIEVVGPAGARIDSIVLPKVSSPAHVIWLDLLLGQVERDTGLPPGQIAIEAQIEDAAGLVAVEQIAVASPRLAALIFGPADFMASVGMRSLGIGARPEGYRGDALHYVHLRLLMAARAAGLQAIDGPYAAISDTDGLSKDAASVAALGFDGKWVVHPDQIAPVNQAFAPDQKSYDRAERILDAYSRATTAEQRGAVMLDDEMIDEATRKLALVTAARGRSAGLARSLQSAEASN